MKFPELTNLILQDDLYGLVEILPKYKDDDLIDYAFQLICSSIQFIGSKTIRFFFTSIDKTGFFASVLDGKRKEVRKMLKANWREIRFGVMALFVVKVGDIDLVRYITNKARIDNHVRKIISLPLFCDAAIQSRSFEVLLKLIIAGTTVSPKSLAYAIHQGNVEMINLISRRWTNVESQSFNDLEKVIKEINVEELRSNDERVEALIEREKMHRDALLLCSLANAKT